MTTLQRLTPGELRGHLGLGDAYAPAPELAGLVDLARLAVGRWRAAPRREVLRYLREQVAACGWDAAAQRERIHGAVALLVSRREIEEVELEGQTHLLAGLARVVTVGDMAFLCGCFEAPPAGLARAEGGDPDVAPVRWLDLDDQRAAAATAEAEEVDLEDWIGEPGVLKHLRRRESDGSTADALWSLLEQRFERADPVGDGAGFRVICGEPGAFFGGARGPNGRWRDAVGGTDGLWCGARRGYGDDATTPALVQVHGGQPARAMDLYDWDELNWLVYGRGVATARPERFALEGAEIRTSSPLPAQLRIVVEALTTQLPQWRYRAPSEAVAMAIHGLLARWLSA